MWTAIVGVLIGLGSVCCRVTVRPQNTVAIRGERTSLECRTTDGSLVRQWSFSRSSDAQKSEIIIFSHWNSHPQFISPRFGVDIDGSGSGILYTNETQFDDGGTYICTTDDKEELTKSSAELIVLDSKPVCSVREYNAGSIKTECSVGFSGNWAPKMEWRHHSRREEAHEAGTPFTNGFDYYTNGTQVTSTLNFVLYSTKDSLSVSCKMFFEARDHSPSGGSATNVPEFVNIWTSPFFGSTDSVPDVGSALTTPRLDVVASDTLSGLSTDDIQSEVSHGTENRSHGAQAGDGDGGKNESWYWALIPVGGGILAIILISILLGAIVCIVRKRKTKGKRKGSVDVTYRKKTDKTSDPNIYDSILLSDENGYRIPFPDSIDGDSHVNASPKELLEPYFVTTSTDLPTSLDAEPILKPRHKSETRATSSYYNQLLKLPNDKVDSRKGPNEQDLDSSKSSESNCVEAGNGKNANYLQLIYDSGDKQGGGTELSPNKGSELAPIGSAAYTRLVLES